VCGDGQRSVNDFWLLLTVTVSAVLCIVPTSGRPTAHHKTIIDLFPGVCRQTGTKIVFSCRQKLVVDLSSFSSVGNLFHAHGCSNVEKPNNQQLCACWPQKEQKGVIVTNVRIPTTNKMEATWRKLNTGYFLIWGNAPPYPSRVHNIRTVISFWFLTYRTQTVLHYVSPHNLTFNQRAPTEFKTPAKARMSIVILIGLRINQRHGQSKLTNDLPSSKTKRTPDILCPVNMPFSQLILKPYYTQQNEQHLKQMHAPHKPKDNKTNCT